MFIELENSRIGKYRFLRLFVYCFLIWCENKIKVEKILEWGVKVRKVVIGLDTVFWYLY